MRFPLYEKEEVQKLRLSVYAKESGEDDLLGEGEVLLEKWKDNEFDGELACFVKGGTEELIIASADWVPLTLEGKERGQVFLEITYYPNVEEVRPLSRLPSFPSYSRSRTSRPSHYTLLAVLRNSAPRTASPDPSPLLQRAALFIALAQPLTPVSAPSPRLSRNRTGSSLAEHQTSHWSCRRRDRGSSPFREIRNRRRRLRGSSLVDLLPRLLGPKAGEWEWYRGGRVGRLRRPVFLSHRRRRSEHSSTQPTISSTITAVKRAALQVPSSDLSTFQLCTTRQPSLLNNTRPRRSPLRSHIPHRRSHTSACLHISNILHRHTISIPRKWRLSNLLWPLPSTPPRRILRLCSIRTSKRPRPRLLLHQPHFRHLLSKRTALQRRKPLRRRSTLLSSNLTTSHRSLLAPLRSHPRCLERTTSRTAKRHPFDLPGLPRPPTRPPHPSTLLPYHRLPLPSSHLPRLPLQNLTSRNLRLRDSLQPSSRLLFPRKRPSLPPELLLHLQPPSLSVSPPPAVLQPPVARTLAN